MWALLLILLFPLKYTNAEETCHTSNTEALFAKTIEASFQSALIGKGHLLTAKARLTFYSEPSEADFGSPEISGVEKVRYIGPDHKLHSSEFVKGFASRDSKDPINKNIYGVGMEGSGYIDPNYHTKDPYLSKMLKMGYRVLNLERWNEATKTATFSLAKAPRGEDSPLIMGVSAAVREGNKLIHSGDCLAIFLPNKKFLGYHLVNDSCSSCKDDEHVDLFLPIDWNQDLKGAASIYSVSRNKCPIAEHDGE